MIEKLKAHIGYYIEEMKKAEEAVKEKEQYILNYHFFKGAKEAIEALLKDMQQEQPAIESSETELTKQDDVVIGDVI